MARFDEDDSLAALVRAIREEASKVGKDFAEVARDYFDKAEYEVDKVVGRQLAKHPELYAELKKTGRSIQRAWQRFERDYLR